MKPPRVKYVAWSLLLFVAVGIAVVCLAGGQVNTSLVVSAALFLVAMVLMADVTLVIDEALKKQLVLVEERVNRNEIAPERPCRK